MIVGGTIGVLAIAAVVGVVVLRSRGSNGSSKDFSQQAWQGQPAMMPNQAGYQQAAMPAMQQQYVQPQQMMQQSLQPVAQQPVQPIAQQPVQPVQPIVQQPPAPQPAAPIQPTTVADYTGLPHGGHYDQSTGQTIYVQADGIRWQMNADGSFNRLN